jgi:hypothetical protein
MLGIDDGLLGSRSGEEEFAMCTGVRSTIVLDSLPQEATWLPFNSHPERSVQVIDLRDGRVHVECFTPVPCDHADLVGQLRSIAISQRTELDALRTP